MGVYKQRSIGREPTKRPLCTDVGHPQVYSYPSPSPTNTTLRMQSLVLPYSPYINGWNREGLRVGPFTFLTAYDDALGLTELVPSS